MLRHGRLFICLKVDNSQNKEVRLKIGKSRQQLLEAAKARCGVKIVFAWIPRYCEDTQRYVWLEKVEKKVSLNAWETGTFTHYYEGFESA